MSYNTMQELCPEEKAMPLSKFYYDYPVHDLPQEEKDQLFADPVDYRKIPDAPHFLDWFTPLGEYTDYESAHCMFPDGSGFISTYIRLPKDLDVKKIFWYLNWLNFHCKSQPEGTGNIRYKIWNPADHWDHYFINWKDKSEGIHTTESLDLGEGDRQYDTIRHPYNMREYGLTQEIMDRCGVGEMGEYETFDFEGAHLCFGQIRPHPEGGFERRSAEWIGWRPENGKIVRVEKTPCSEEYLKKVAYHTVLEWKHLTTFIDDLYDEYSKLPNDAD
ncbi:MAG: hypothetical protein E7233_08290 [Lachnospiraceae bacterium]|nr:hypothetical protein [Lachnospiraceae bacterium]